MSSLVPSAYFYPYSYSTTDNIRLRSLGTHILSSTPSIEDPGEVSDIRRIRHPRALLPQGEAPASAVPAIKYNEGQRQGKSTIHTFSFHKTITKSSSTNQTSSRVNSRQDSMYACKGTVLIKSREKQLGRDCENLFRNAGSHTQKLGDGGDGLHDGSLERQKLALPSSAYLLVVKQEDSPQNVSTGAYKLALPLSARRIRSREDGENSTIRKNENTLHDMSFDTDEIMELGKHSVGTMMTRPCSRNTLSQAPDHICGFRAREASIRSVSISTPFLSSGISHYSISSSPGYNFPPHHQNCPKFSLRAGQDGNSFDWDVITTGHFLSLFRFHAEAIAVKTLFFILSLDDLCIRYGPKQNSWEFSIPFNKITNISFGSKSTLFSNLFTNASQKFDGLLPDTLINSLKEWNCFTITSSEGLEFNLAVDSQKQLQSWILGLQSLCPHVNIKFSAGKLALESAIMKFKATARLYHLSLRSLVYVLLMVERMQQRREQVQMHEFKISDGGQQRQGSVSVSGSGLCYEFGSMSTAASESISKADKLPADRQQQHIEKDVGSNMHAHNRTNIDDLHMQLDLLKLELQKIKDENINLKRKLKVEGEFWETSYDELKFTENMGGGAYSELWRGRWRGTRVAIKMINPSNNADKRSIEDAWRAEVNILSRLRHPNIVLFMTACMNDSSHCIVMEFLRGGNLYNAIRKSLWRNLDNLDLIHLSRGMARGLAYLHSLGLIHRDVKSHNMLLDSPLEAGRPNVKVADFGFSRVNKTFGDEIMTSETGTYRWMAPEVIRHEAYSESIDVYSYGIILWEMWSCELPFSSMSPIQAAFAVAEHERRPEVQSDYGKAVTIPNVWKKLIESCWQTNASARPSFRDVITILDEIEQHPDQVPSYWQSAASDFVAGS